MDIEVAKQYLKMRIEKYQSHKEQLDFAIKIYGENNVKEYHKKQQAIETVLNELEKKEAIINKMAELIYKYINLFRYYEVGIDHRDKDDVIEYFRKKVSNKQTQ